MTPERPAQSSPKYLDPELHFKRQQRTIGDPEDEKKVSVSQLVRAGEVLADFPNYLRLKKKGYLRSPMEAGENVTFDPEQYALVAAVSGYPKSAFREQENEDPDLLIISITPLVKISHNKMQASLVLHPPLPDAPSIESIDLEELVQEAGVIYGIDTEAMEEAKRIAAGPCDDFEEIVIAKGTYPGEGEDASLQFELEIGPLAGHILDDGTIDFRDRRIMVGVKANQHIATKIPAVAGEPGYNVLGEEIESKTGRDIKVNASGDARFLAKENRVIATSDGTMSVVNANTIKVASRATVGGDVDYNTGNISSEKNITITGSVQPDFKVEAGGDLEIKGSITSAKIQCGGNVVVKGGITGVSSIIGASGDININFIERGTIKAGGLVVIRKQSYYSSIEAAGDIRCHPQSTIMGGILLAGGSLTVGNVGAENCEPAVLGAGIDPGRYLLFKQLQKELKKQREEVIQAIQIHGKGGRPKKIRRLEEAAEETKIKLLKLNLIPGTELYSRKGEGNEREDLDEEDPIYLKDANIENIRIEVRGKMYAGTTILLGNRSATLSQDAEKRKYRLSKNLKRIMALPL